MSQLNDLIAELTFNNEAYANGEPTALTDQQYDDKLLELKALQPAHVLLTGVGAAVRGSKVPLPYKMGSLDQVYDGDTEKWVIDKNLKEANITITNKMDGCSAEIIYDDDGNLQIAFSRGNGLEGADITRHISRITSVPQKITTLEKMTIPIRAECIMSRFNFKNFQEECSTRNYKAYKNPRNAVAGLLNSKTIPDWIYKYLDVIAFELISDLDKSVQLEELQILGFKTVEHSVVYGAKLNDSFLTGMIHAYKGAGVLSDYEQDGVVLDIEFSHLRKQMNPSINSLNPAYAKKFKTRDAANIATTTCKGVEWGISKHGFLKPRINIEPVNLNGVTIDFCTGFNAKFIVDNYIGEGAVIKLTRSGDVIPHILDVVTPAMVPDIPDSRDYAPYGWNETEVDFVLDNPKGNKTVAIKEITYFFESLEVPKLKIGMATKLYDAGYDTIPKIINMYEVDFMLTLGKVGFDIFNGIDSVLNNVTAYNFMGSLTLFGRGVGKRRFEMLYDHYGQCEDLSIDHIIAVSGFEFKTACKIMDNMNEYREVLNQIHRDIVFVDKVVHSGKLDGKVFVFTGFRDKASQEAIEKDGGTIGRSVNKDTTFLVAKDPNSKSSKFDKARKLGVSIISIDDMLGML